VLVRGKRLPRLIDDDGLRVFLAGRPRRGKRTVGNRIGGPRHRHEETRHRRIGPQQVRAVAAVQHFEDRDLLGREPRRELRGRFRQRLEPVSGRSRGR
jgi:hypothetical protein